MLSLWRGRVARRLRVLTELARQKVCDRERAREKAAALASIGKAVAAAGIDPANNPGLRYFAGADRALSKIGDTPELRRADAAFVAQDTKLARREGLVAQVAARAAGFAARPPPNPGAGSAFDWYAWSLAFLSRPEAGAECRVG